MTGWKDIDGTNVMAGSPGIIDCLGIEFRQLLGSLPGQRDGKQLSGRFSLESVERLLRRVEPSGETRRRVLLAAQLVAFAERLLIYGGDEETDEKRARAAIKTLARGLPERHLARGEYWWRKVDPWGNDGSEGPEP